MRGASSTPSVQPARDEEEEAQEGNAIVDESERMRLVAAYVA